MNREQPSGARRNVAALRLTCVVVVAAVAIACSASQSRGPEWRAACNEHATRGCPCHADDQCETLWCVNGECEHRDP